MNKKIKQQKITSYFQGAKSEDTIESEPMINTRHVPQEYLEMCTAIKKLELLVGAQVMLISNLDQEKGLVNGSRGIVIRFTDEGLPIVKFLNGVQEVIDYHQWEMENDNKIVGGVVQIPLKLAYATTIHKSQGSTLDYVIINLDKLFEVSQGYVGLSRVTHLEGLSIKGLDIHKFVVNRDALEFYKNLENRL